jgi:hypothetical protein
MIHVEHQQELKWTYKTKEFNRDDYYVPGNHLVVSFELTQGVGREGCPGPSLYPAMGWRMDRRMGLANLSETNNA